MDRVNYLCTKIVYPVDRIRINCVYNTPIPIEPLETELVELQEKYSQLRVIKVPGSKSKADNLNYFFALNTCSDIIAIFDADHYPHPHNPRWAAERFVADAEVGIVQGRCIIYNSRDSWLTRLIAIEFDKIYAVSHPGRAIMMDFGLFCGKSARVSIEATRTDMHHRKQRVLARRLTQGAQDARRDVDRRYRLRAARRTKERQSCARDKRRFVRARTFRIPRLLEAAASMGAGLGTSQSCPYAHGVE